ncbi:glutamate-1-semialdehyde 2,1-aminomutase [Alicyclobacillus tolerans]|uniref:glutamate-1-semialdehyde 2,1-aminomutase n=1 Tax=Alicyclobacillus tolerans TaxID=90970 RepID=UPI001F01E48D|nr:glutamate-1-semialdehyde 2,1-aminomutase [Alicyclobacillus tolerans]MCF8563539.1 glutamate-1-semialdehyde 2,1-aminomutase [Alicyclobacillus tolerans]
MSFSRSETAFNEAKQVLPGGVNSPVRAFRAVGGTPFFADRGEGPYLYDIDGNRYIDYLLSWGPLIWGHAHPAILNAIVEVASKGTSFGVPTELETKMAEKVVSLVPSVEIIRMVNSGTEATMSALRLARAYTKRNAIVKFDGCYHGHSDSLLVKAGSGVATFGLPDSPGVSKATAETTFSVPYNDLDALRELFQERGEEIAAVIIEPVAGNMGCVLPRPGYLQAVRELTRSYGALLICDEVMTGFRVALGGAQAYYGLDPDLTTLGKVIGAGMPVGAYGGKREIMAMVAPEGPVYQAGTLSGNPLAMAAGLKSLEMLEEAETQGLYKTLQQYGGTLCATFQEAGKERGIAVYGHAIGGMFGLFFQEGPVFDYEGAAKSDKDLYARFFHALLRKGVALAPSQLESGFLSAVHTDDQLQHTQQAIREAMAEL